MYSFVRKTMLATALLVAASSMVEAQERREKELRLDVAGLESNDGTTTFGRLANSAPITVAGTAFDFNHPAANAEVRAKGIGS